MAAGKAAGDAKQTRLTAGFTLVEIAVVIGIVALILGALLPLITAQTGNARMTATRSHQDSIRTALITYIARHGYLPCPADPWALPGAAGYGHEARAAVTALPAGRCDGLAAGHAPTAFVTYDTSSANFAIPSVTVYRGLVPWLDLGLPEEIANDAWNQRISYVVTDLAVMGYATREAISGMLGGLVLCDGVGATSKLLTPVPATAPTGLCAGGGAALPQISVQTPAVALISHGENGYGAFVPPQTATATAGTFKPYAGLASAAEVANIDLAQGVLVQANYARSFDDLVTWLTPADLTAPLIQTGSLPGVQAQMTQRFAEAKAAVIAATASVSKPMTDASGNAAGYEYFLCQPVADAQGNPLFVWQSSAGLVGAGNGTFGLVPQLLPTLPATASTQAASTWYFSYEGQYSLGPPAQGSNRMPGLARQPNYDPWGNPLLFSTTLSVPPGPLDAVAFTSQSPVSSQHPYAFVIYSVGPDGYPGTGDDAALAVTVGEMQNALRSASLASVAADAQTPTCHVATSP